MTEHRRTDLRGLSVLKYDIVSILIAIFCMKVIDILSKSALETYVTVKVSLFLKIAIC